MDTNNEYEKECAKFCRRMMDRHLSEANCVFDHANAESIDRLRYFMTAEYATPTKVRDEWALSWDNL